MQIVKKTINMTSCQSTNDEAMRLLKENTFKENFIVNTFSQLKGRGQYENSWISEDGKNLTFSLVIAPSFIAPKFQFQLTIISSLAAVSFLNKYNYDKFSIKWPNDILYKGKKICGILIENIIKGNILAHSIIGVGLNVNQDSFEFESAISLKQITSKEYELPILLDELSDTILDFCERYESNKKEFNKEYLSNLFRYGEWAKYSIEGKVIDGKIIGVSDIGMLRLELMNGSIQEFGLKEIKFI